MNKKLLIDLSQVRLSLPHKLNCAVMNVAGAGLGVNKLNRHYNELVIEDNFYASTLKKLGIGFNIQGAEEIPKEGGCIILANHPFGAVEGVILGAFLSKLRSDFKFMGNGLLQMIQEMREDVIAVNPFGSKASVSGNAGGLREAIRWVKEGHVLVIFPAGEVSSLRLRHFKIEDPKWSKHIGWVAEKAGAPVLPLFFQGRNSWSFQTMGLVHPVLRTIMLPRELLNKSGQVLQARVGRLIRPKHFAEFKDAQTLTDYFRHQTYALSTAFKNKVQPSELVRVHKFQAITTGPSREELTKEIEGLKASALLVQRGRFKVYADSYVNLPFVMREIGRLRELTFRAAGEGTGKSIDLDKYDEYYMQLFLWDCEKQELVGAYRLGHTREILQSRGPQGLYSNSLFKLRSRHWETLSSGIEMGRSFIRAEYQKEPMCLPLLWRGISQYILRFPDYHSLYGCVSICSEYQRSSIDLMIDYLQQFRPAPATVAKVKPRVPHIKKQRHLRKWLKGLDPSKMNPEQLSQMISKLEPDGKGIPVLLRHYLRVGSQILSFNVDRDFSDVVDALILLDLTKTESKLIERFMNKDEAIQISKQSESDDRSLA